MYGKMLMALLGIALTGCPKLDDLQSLEGDYGEWGDTSCLSESALDSLERLVAILEEEERPDRSLLEACLGPPPRGRGRQAAWCSSGDHGGKGRPSGPPSPEELVADLKDLCSNERAVERMSPYLEGAECAEKLDAMEPTITDETDETYE